MLIDKMHGLTEEKIQKKLFLGLAVTIFLLPLPQFFFPDAPKAVSMQATILMLSLFYFCFAIIAGLVNGQMKGAHPGIAVRCIGGLFLAGIFSVLLSQDKMTALYGAVWREEGFFTLMSYYVIFLVTVILEKRYRRVLLYLFLGFGVCISVLGVLQFTGFFTFGSIYAGIACIPMRNPNFFGAFAVLFTGAAIGGFFTYSEESEVTHPFSRCNRFVWYIIVLMGYAACICSSSSLVYAGLIMLLLMYFFLELFTKRKKLFEPVALTVSLVVMIFLFNAISGGSVMNECTSVIEQIQAEGSLFGDSVGTGRMLAWKNIVALLPQYGWSGCGIEQLGALYLSRYGVMNGIYFDKAHNEYLNLWITEGIAALVFYLVFLFALFFTGIGYFNKERKGTPERNTGDEIAGIAFFAFFGYIAQAFFNISVVQVAPYFWMICGLLYRRER